MKPGDSRFCEVCRRGPLRSPRVLHPLPERLGGYSRPGSRVPRGTFRVGEDALPLHENVRCGVDIAVVVRTARGAVPRPYRQRQGVEPVPAGRAGLARRVEAADLDKGAPTLGALVLKQPCELAERGVRHGFRQMMVLHHALSIQVLHAQDLVLVREHGRDLVKGIGSGIGDLRVNPGNPLPLLQVPPRLFLALASTLPAGEPALFPRKLALVFLEVARLSDLATVRERRKCLDAEIDSDLPVGRGCVLGRHVGAEEGGEVAAGCVQGDRDRHETPLERSGYLSTDSPELRQRDMVAVDDLAAVGAVRLSGVPARLELGEARLPALAHTSEEVLVGAVEVADGLLERHGVRLREPGGLGVAFPRRQHSGELRPRDRLAGLAVGGLLDVEGAVVHEPAATEGPRDLLALARVRVDSVFESALHRLGLLLVLDVLP